MNVRQFIKNKKEEHHSKRSQQLQSAMQENKIKLQRAEQEKAYLLQKEKLRKTKENNRRLKTAPLRKLSGQAKTIMNKIQSRPQGSKKISNPTKQKTIKIILEEPKKEEPKNVWRM